MNARIRDGINFIQEFVLTIFKPRSAKAVEALKIAVLCTVICASTARTQVFRPEHRDLDEIKASGEIVMALPDNAPALFMYEGKPMGYEYDLSKSFADSLGVKLKIVTYSQWSDMEDALRKGEVDLAAPSVPVVPRRYEGLSFSSPYVITRSAVVTHRDSGQDYRIAGEDLAGFSGSSEFLSTTVPDFGEKSFGETSRLVSQVAVKKIHSTVINEHIAKNAQRNFPETVIGKSLGPDLGISWAMNSSSRRLLHKVNSFFSECGDIGLFEELSEKYFSEIEGLDKIDTIAFLERIKNSLPSYRGIIKSEAKTRGFDWRLIAALIYQESSFDHRAEGGAGAAGLMQILPATAADLGATNPMNPSSNIRAGVKYLKDMMDLFAGETETDRINFALAAYNMGPRHIEKARKIARAKGLNHLKWKDVSRILCGFKKGGYGRKSSGYYYRGDRTVNYVRRIMAYYEILKYREIKPPPICIYWPSPSEKV